VPATPLRVAAVQTNIPQREKFDPKSAAKIYDAISRLTEAVIELKPAPELIVWRRARSPGLGRTKVFLDSFMTYRSIQKSISSLVSTTSRKIMLTTPRHSFPDKIRKAQIYHKIHLVPFGEYVPLRHSFPLFAAVAGHGCHPTFDFGQEFTIFRLTKSNVQVAPLICFEDTDVI